MAKTIFKSLVQKPATHKYPFEPLPKDPLVRGQVSIDINGCIFCGLCERKCPTRAIKVVKDDKSWEISRFQCIVCNACAEACPKKCLCMINRLNPASGEKITDKSTAADA